MAGIDFVDLRQTEVIILDGILLIYTNPKFKYKQGEKDIMNYLHQHEIDGENFIFVRNRNGTEKIEIDLTNPFNL